MTIDYDRLMAWRFPPVHHTLTRNDCILYALGVGLGGDPLDPAQLGFLYEENLEALPTMAAVRPSRFNRKALGHVTEAPTRYPSGSDLSPVSRAHCTIQQSMPCFSIRSAA